jgi:hypothetical protein
VIAALWPWVSSPTSTPTERFCCLEEEFWSSIPKIAALWSFGCLAYRQAHGSLASCRGSGAPWTDMWHASCVLFVTVVSSFASVHFAAGV